MFVGVGNPVYDYIKTPQVTTGERVLSGCSTNACLALRKLDAQAALVGCIGPDYQTKFEADMRRYSIDFEVFPSEETGGFSLIYDNRGDRTLDVLGVAKPIPEFPTRFASAEFVLVGPILSETPLDLIHLIRQRCSAPMILDPQGMLRRVIDGRIEHYRNPEIDTTVSLFDIVKGNEQEAHIITGINPRDGEQAAVESAKALHALGCKIAIVTLAANGSVIYDGSETIRIPAYKTNAKDPTGAGDTYAAGFMYSYLRNGNSLREAGYFASCVASVMVENTGPGFPLTIDEAQMRTAHLLSGKRAAL